MMYIDKSKNEKGELEFSLHNLSYQDVMLLKSSFQFVLSIYKLMPISPEDLEMKFRMMKIYTYLTILEATKYANHGKQSV